MAMRYLLPALISSLSLHVAGVAALPGAPIPEATTPPAPAAVEPRAPAPTTVKKVADAPPYLGGVPTVLRSSLIPSSYAGCEKTGRCEIRYPTVDIFYFPKSAGKTECLATLTRTHTPAPAPTNMVSPSIYLVLAPRTLYDGCGSIMFRETGRSTSLYRPGGLSTIHPLPSGTAEYRKFNFDDIPCPPKEIQALLDPGAPYTPVIILNSGVPYIFGNGESMQCDSFAIMDPPTPAFDMNWDDMGYGGGDGGW